MADPLTAVQLAEVQFLADGYDDDPAFLLAHVVPFARWVRSEGVTLPALAATGFGHLPYRSLAPLVIAAVLMDPPPGFRPSRFDAALRRLVDALEPAESTQKG